MPALCYRAVVSDMMRFKIAALPTTHYDVCCFVLPSKFFGQLFNCSCCNHSLLTCYLSRYVLTLAWSYTPSGTGYSNVDQKELELTGVEEWMEDDTLSDGEGSFDFGGH
eukprot:330074_1